MSPSDENTIQTGSGRKILGERETRQLNAIKYVKWSTALVSNGFGYVFLVDILIK